MALSVASLLLLRRLPPVGHYFTPLHSREFDQLEQRVWGTAGSAQGEVSLVNGCLQVNGVTKPQTLWGLDWLKAEKGACEGRQGAHGTWPHGSWFFRLVVPSLHPMATTRPVHAMVWTGLQVGEHVEEYWWDADIWSGWGGGLCLCLPPKTPHPPRHPSIESINGRNNIFVVDY